MSENRKLIEEILWNLKDNGLEEQDIFWIGSMDGKYVMDWDDFKEKFNDIEYDSGFGAQEIASDLVMVMNDGTYFNRSEYDGAEGWEYNKVPVKSYNPKSFEFISVNQIGETGWKDLESMNQSEKGNCKRCNEFMIVYDFNKGYCNNCRRELEHENYKKTGKFELNE